MSQFSDRKILVVEDQPEMRQELATLVESIGCAVEVAADGVAGLEKALSGDFDLVILDVMLPRMHGLDVCTQLRAAGKLLPVLMLTARDEEVDKVLGLEIGADDYVAKPFSTREVAARIRALLRRLPGPAGEMVTDDIIAIGPLKIDARKRHVLFNGVEVRLTSIEYNLLLYMAQRPGKPVSREHLLEAIWGSSGEMYTSTLAAHISRLRVKLELDPLSPRLIHTIPKVGYRFATPGDFTPVEP